LRRVVSRVRYRTTIVPRIGGCALAWIVHS
jgi:hypothetical protein